MFQVLLLVALGQVAGLQYMCTDIHYPGTKTFETITDYQGNDLSFRFEYNYVNFETDNIPLLERNVFVTYQSNYIRKLWLDNKQILTIDPGAFNELYCLQNLMLQNNRIGKLSNGTFHGLYSLEQLDLSSNFITELPAEVFYNLTSLRELNLSRNKIHKLHSMSLQYLGRLWTLNIRYNKLEEIPNDLFKPTVSLKQLYLGQNRLFSPHSRYFYNLDHLDLLDLSYNNIAVLDVKILSKFIKMTTLMISGNRLTDLDVNALKACQNLQKVYINDNRWQCAILTRILAELEREDIGVVVNDETIKRNVDIRKVNCYEHGQLIVPTTTTTKPTTKPTNEPSTSSPTKPRTNPTYAITTPLVPVRKVSYFHIYFNVFFFVIIVMALAYVFYKKKYFAVFSRRNRNYSNLDDEFPLISPRN